MSYIVHSSPTTSENGFALRAGAAGSISSSIHSDFSAVQPTPLRNLAKDFFEVNEEMEVYVRIKPSKDSSTNVLSVSGNHVIVQPPKDSASFKNRTNAGTKTLQKFKFNKIFDASVSQEALFKSTALNLVQEFIFGKNALLFTYGATSAGKTYTMLGKIRDAGLLPRSLDVIFNSLEGQLLSSPLLKPLALNEIMKLNPHQTEAEEMERSLLMRGFDLDGSDAKDSISTTVSTGSLKDWSIRARDSTVCNLQYPEDFYSVWVSYCEIYNEQAFDLLEGCDKKKKRTPLRVTEDRKGKFYVKGLKEICVRTADEAVRVLLYGKENLHFAATKLNHNSSRSHCVFTVKVIRTNDCDEPTSAAINMMSFVDLAGMERTTKTQSKGERLKEAGNINTSLLVLGRCIDAMRANQHNPGSSKMMIPYRESKLTRILQTFFSGQGRAAMFVNVSPSALLCDETLHVLKFGALAQEVIIQPDKDQSVAEVSLFAPPLRPSRFQQYVRKSISMMSARASVLEVSNFQAIGEDDEGDLKARILDLEEELARLREDWDNHETRVRDECCAEWTEVVTKMEQAWMQRHEDTKARYEEFCEARVNLVTQLMDSTTKKKKRKVSESEDLEHLALQFKDKDDRIEILEESNQRLTEMVEKLKASLEASEEARGELQQDMTRLRFETAATSKPKMFFGGPQSDEEDSEEETSDADNDIVAKLKAKLASKEELLNEAVIDFHSKNEELSKALQENELLKKQLSRSTDEIVELQARLEKSNLLLSDANERLDVREEELMNVEEKLMKANGMYGSINTELREAKRRLRDYEMRLKEQNNTSAMSSMCEDLQKQILDAESQLEKRKDEIERLNKEVSRWKNRALAGEDSQVELDKLRGQLAKTELQLANVQKELAALKESNEDLKARRESLLDEVSHLKRDLELSSSERKQEEGAQSELAKENERLRQTIAEMSKLAGDSKEFQKTLMEYEGTIKELTLQLEQLKGAQRERNLLEEELEALAKTLGRVQLDKNQMEKEVAGQKSEVDRLAQELASTKEEKAALKSRLEESQRRQVELLEKLQGLQDESKSSAGSVAAELLAAKTQARAEWQEKCDRMERESEKLTKEMLKHMRRADELTETLAEVNAKLQKKAEKCDSLSKRLAEFESKSKDFNDVQSKLAEKERAVMEKENQAKTLQDMLSKQEASIQRLKQEHDRVLVEKNLDINRLETELKSILSGHVNYKKPSMPSIKIEKAADDDQEEDLATMMATPTPVKSRRPRTTKKAASPESAQKEDVATNPGSSRTRRTIKSVDFPTPAEPAPPSSSKSSARKPRKNKSENEEVAHPALSVLSSEEVDGNEGATPLSGHNSKRRLYNSKCPEVLLPSNNKQEEVNIEFPKRMATRSRRQ